MSQSSICMNLRYRLSRRGYTDISICRLKDNDQRLPRYRVIAREPLANLFIVRDMSLEEMFHFGV